jgi:hypothetical protein
LRLTVLTRAIRPDIASADVPGRLGIGFPLGDIHDPVSFGPLRPALGGADADAGEVGQHRGGELSGKGEPCGVPACVSVDAVALEPDAEEDV